MQTPLKFSLTSYTRNLLWIGSNFVYYHFFWNFQWLRLGSLVKIICPSFTNTVLKLSVTSFMQTPLQFWLTSFMRTLSEIFGNFVHYHFFWDFQWPRLCSLVKITVPTFMNTVLKFSVTSFVHTSLKFLLMSLTLTVFYIINDFIYEHFSENCWWLRLCTLFWYFTLHFCEINNYFINAGYFENIAFEKIWNALNDL